MGGLNRLSQAMARAARENGATLRMSTPVRRLVVEGGAAVGVELEDGTIERADHVVVNADFGHAATRLIEARHRRRWTDARIASRRYSCSAFMLHLGVKRRYDDVPHHSLIFGDDYARSIAEAVRGKGLPEDPSFYVQNASVTDPSLAPPGKSALYVLVPVPNNTSGIDWQREGPAFRQRVLEALERKAGFGGLSESIELERVLTPEDWERQMDIYQGATFHMAHSVFQMLYFRPHNEFEDLSHCYLVGGGTHPGASLPLVCESGRIVHDLILDRDA
jgi:phytoene desaturase